MLLPKKSYENYWFSTGTPTFLIELLQQMNFDIRLLDRMDAKPEDFDKATDCLTDLFRCSTKAVISQSSRTMLSFVPIH